jgi:hypothetical protein
MFFNVFFSVKQEIQVSLLVGELSKTGKLDDLSYTYWDENFTSKVTVSFPLRTSLLKQEKGCRAVLLCPLVTL